MTNRLITVERAKEEIERLQNYINLVENYETDTVEKWIIKQYAITNNFSHIVNLAKEDGIKLDGNLITREVVSRVINGPLRKNDELHRVLRRAYRKRYRSQRKEYW